MKTPSGRALYEFEIKRSRFIAEVEGCSNREGAEDIIRRRREEHPNATHVVYAFSIGDEKNRQFGMSDDGEPKGTAGRPVLEILRGSDVTDCVLTVVRYFGGTKLGTGGLVHAYGDAAKGVLKKLKTTEKRDLVPFSLQIPYELHQPVHALLEQYLCEIGKETFTEQVELEGHVDRRWVNSLDKDLLDVSRGTCSINNPVDTTTPD